MGAPTPPPVAEVIHVIRLDDPIVEALGHRPDSRYAETFWLPILGPSSLWALRRITLRLEAFGPYDQNVAELGLELGLSRGQVVRSTVQRLARFGIAVPHGDTWAVRTMVAPLPRALWLRLPEHLQEAHTAELRRQQDVA